MLRTTKSAPVTITANTSGVNKHPPIANTTEFDKSRPIKQMTVPMANGRNINLSEVLIDGLRCRPLDRFFDRPYVVRYWQ